jgi:hypothetical protein
MCGCKRAIGGRVEPATASSDEPVAIEYKKWRNKRDGYEVTVLGVHHQPSPSGGYHSTVTVRGTKVDSERTASWPATVFLQTFEPMGRRLKIPTRWERLNRKSNRGT